MNDSTSADQPLSAKRAEASYRQGRGSALAAHEPAAAHHRAQLLVTLADLGSLADRGVALSPFLEIGAGRAYRGADRASSR